MDPARGRGGGAEPTGDVSHLESGVRHHHRDASSQYFSGVAFKITLVFLVVATACLLLNQSAYDPIEFFQRSREFSGNLPATSFCDNRGAALQNASAPLSDQFTPQELPSLAKEENELAAILRKAATEDNKTVIITTVNAAWADPGSVFDLFLESFRIGIGTEHLLKHIVVGAMDQRAYSRCLEKNLHCYALTTEDVDFSGEAHFMSEDYLKMVWSKIDFQRKVLELGYDFIFTDADVMWWRDPLPRFYPDGDLQISCDHYWAPYDDLANSPNSGFIYVRSNNRSIQFYEFWYNGREYFPGKHDQDVFNFIKGCPFTEKLGLEIRFLNTTVFGGFCEAKEDMDAAVTLHANCCIGLELKIHDISKVIDDWKKYMSLTGGAGRNSSNVTWTVPRNCY